MKGENYETKNYIDTDISIFTDTYNKYVRKKEKYVPKYAYVQFNSILYTGSDRITIRK